MNKGQKQAALEQFGEAVEAFNEALSQAARAGLLREREDAWDFTGELLDQAIEAAE